MNKASETNSSDQNKVDQIKQIFKVLDTINDLTQSSWIQDQKIIQIKNLIKNFTGVDEKSKGFI